MSADQPSPNTATVYDSALRWTVPSRTNAAETYVVDLGAYNGEGRCSCRDFAIRFEKFLAKGLTPQLAWDEKWLGDNHQLREYQLGPEDCLSCWHLVNARRMLARQVVRSFTIAKKAQQA